MAYYSHMPEYLYNQISIGRCILFVGAGISKKCITTGRKSLPSWHEFLQEFIEWENHEQGFDEEYYKNLISLLETKKYPLVAEELLENIESKEFQHFLQKSFDSSNIVPSHLHKLIAMIPFRGIVTTNYDNLIELSYVDEKRKIPKVFTNNHLLQDKNPLDSDFFILKMHGEIEDPSSIVLSYKSYLKVMYDSPTYRDLIEKIFLDYSVLFVGYGGQDENIESLLNRVAFQNPKTQHYVLSREGTFSPIEVKRYQKDRQLEIIEYVDYFNLHNHIDTFFEDIVDKLKEQKIIPSSQPKTMRTTMYIFYDEVDFEDGIFLHQYIFKEGAITLSIQPQLEQHLRIMQPIDELCHVNFLVFYFGNLDFQSSNFVKRVDQIVKEQKKCKIIILSLEKNKEIIEEKFRTQTIFYVKDDFIDSDLETMKEYVINHL